MARSRPKTRRHPRANPRGVLRVMGDGYGFVKTSEGEFFIPSKKMGGAFDGDVVELAPASLNQAYKQPGKKNNRPGEKPTARVVRVVDRAHETLLGRYEIAEPFGVVIPEDRRIPYDIFTMRADCPEAQNGDFVRVRVSNYPSRNTAATGVVEEILGSADEESMAVELIIARHKLETRFSAASLEQARQATLDEVSALADGYRDIRDRVVFTVDPADARDFDDALSLDKVEGLWRLGVHIADVARYVPWGSSIDLDARRRTTSVYLVDRVIPMLPEELSNELCSLKPHATRLAMTVDMFLSPDGQVKRFDIYSSVIQSSARFSYDQVQEVLDAGRQATEFEQRFQQLHQLTGKLVKNAQARGAIEFVATEAKVQLDEDGAPTEVVLRKKTDATEIIEQAMILANTTVASYLHKRDFPCAYRVHEQPSEDSLADLIPVLQEFDYFKHVSKAAFVEGNPQVIQELLTLSKGKPEEELISFLLLRAMKRAEYKPSCEGHYGLGLEEYAHFTSPIRRYPDLIVHRMLKAKLKKKSGTFEAQVDSLEWLCQHSSAMERVAEKAARDSQELKMIEYLERFVGQTFEALIVSVTSYGFFVRLDNTAEGLVSLKTLGNEYFIFDQERHMLIGEETGVKYRLGQRVQVILEQAQPRLGRLDFRITHA